MGYGASSYGQHEGLPCLVPDQLLLLLSEDRLGCIRLSHGANRWFGLGLTLVDSLDTLHIMGLNQELAEAREWVGRNLILDQASSA